VLRTSRNVRWWPYSDILRAMLLWTSIERYFDQIATVVAIVVAIF
jgi:hypothetical protein